jgi:D-alanyl-D-alanine carboxypeptidase/D-alanyl-D-alanine-endopeptidase (penicillin-binding protein 4)
MLKQFLLFSFSLYSLCSYSQKGSLESFLADSSMIHASVSLYIAETDNQEVVLEYNSGRSLTPASVMKLITSAAALELLGPQYTFKTVIGYTGVLNKKTGKLKGDIVIRGGGDPALGSPYFADHYNGSSMSGFLKLRNSVSRKLKGGLLQTIPTTIISLYPPNGYGKMPGIIMVQGYMDYLFLTILMIFIS